MNLEYVVSKSTKATITTTTTTTRNYWDFVEEFGRHILL